MRDESQTRGVRLLSYSRDAQVFGLIYGNCSTEQKNDQLVLDALQLGFLGTPYGIELISNWLKIYTPTNCAEFGPQFI